MADGPMQMKSRVERKTQRKSDGTEVIETTIYITEIYSRKDSSPSSSLPSTTTTTGNNFSRIVGTDISKGQGQGQVIQGDQFQREALEQHNMYRAKHGVPPLKLSKEICESAQNYANYLAKIRKLEHSKNSKYGENLFWSMGRKVSGADAVDSWYAEIKDYKGNFSSGTGHFTQVVWKNSKFLGIGQASIGDEQFVVAQYDPRGNIMGEFKDNVLPLKN